MKSLSEKKKTINWQQKENIVYTTTDNSVISAGGYFSLEKRYQNISF